MQPAFKCETARHGDRKSTRLNSSHSQISYAVFCLKKKKKNDYPHVNIPGSAVRAAVTHDFITHTSGKSTRTPELASHALVDSLVAIPHSAPDHSSARAH